MTNEENKTVILNMAQTFVSLLRHLHTIIATAPNNEVLMNHLEDEESKRKLLSFLKNAPSSIETYIHDKNQKKELEHISYLLYGILSSIKRNKDEFERNVNALMLLVETLHIHNNDNFYKYLANQILTN